MKTVLAIGAHPDDIEIDCAGTISREIDRGNEVFFYIVTKGNLGGDPLLRKEEAIRSAELLGVKEIIFEDLEDCSLRYDRNSIGKIIRMIKEINPYRIYSHSEKDPSPDHLEVGRATLLGSRNVLEIFTYRGSPYYTGFNPNCFVDISEYLRIKELALLKFESQNAKDQFGLDYITANAIYYGRMSNSGIKYAEAFEIVKKVRL